MKLLSTALAAFALFAATVDGSSMLQMEAEGKNKTSHHHSKHGVQQQDQQTQQQDQQQTQQQVLSNSGSSGTAGASTTNTGAANNTSSTNTATSTSTSSGSGTSTSTSSGSACNLTGTYKAGTDISSCSSINIGPLTVPAGVTLDLTKTKSGATITFTGTTTFGTQKWEGQSITRPVFFRLRAVTSSTLSGFTIKNSPFRTFSVLNSQKTTISGLLLDSRAGDGKAKNTDGFDLSRNDGITITGNKIYNQDDCLAMQSSTNTVFSNNYCCGGHGVSIGSLGGAAVDQSSTVQGLTVQNNTIVNSDNGIRIKTIIGLQGLVSNVKYVQNKLSNVKNAIVMHSDYSKAKGGYTGDNLQMGSYTVQI
ncbi:hypothetical protein PF011_g29758 [Phytophthora fragariae]|uniref:endo-polygalacturonase n=1 Tax=Phytophthora fragariae TaxID=53985 RepID=A0A6A3GXE0_9STRA|nr:hypothetical protein PF011_g29758 [Phytophthora fragariae]